MQENSAPPLILREGRCDSLTHCADDLVTRGTCLVLVERAHPRAKLPLPLACEREAAAHFPDALRADGYLLRRQIARQIIAEATGIPADRLRIRANEAGALHIEGMDMPLHLSFSARGDWGLIGIARHPIGVDLELAIAPEAIPVNVLRPDEREVLHNHPEAERASAFLQMWTLKEAIAKALGRGFMIAPEAIAWRNAGTGKTIVIDNAAHSIIDETRLFQRIFAPTALDGEVIAPIWLSAIVLDAKRVIPA